MKLAILGLLLSLAGIACFFVMAYRMSAPRPIDQSDSDIVALFAGGMIGVLIGAALVFREDDR